MENKSNVSGISERSLSNFTHFSDDALSQISDLSTSQVNLTDLNQNQLFVRQANKLEFWNTYSDILKHHQFDKGYLLAESLLAEFEPRSSMRRNHLQNLPEPWAQMIKTFSQGSQVLSKWQKAYYRSMARCCMSQCLYLSDGKPQDR